MTLSIPKHIIDFKNEQTKAEFDKVSPRLQAFILATGSYMYFTFGVTLVVTALMRENPKSVHGHGNGVDYRTKDLTDEQGDALVKFCKWQMPYYLNTPMPDRPKYSIRDEREPDTSPDWDGSHIHGQVNWREA